MNRFSKETMTTTFVANCFNLIPRSSIEGVSVMFQTAGDLFDFEF